MNSESKPGKIPAKHEIQFGSGLITELDISRYTGEVGQIIRTTTRHGSQDTGVRITIKDLLGVAIECGYSQWDHPSSSWHYLTQAHASRDELWIIQATAFNQEAKTTRELASVPASLSRRPRGHISQVNNLKTLGIRRFSARSCFSCSSTLCCSSQPHPIF